MELRHRSFSKDSTAWTADPETACRGAGYEPSPPSLCDVSGQDGEPAGTATAARKRTLTRCRNLRHGRPVNGGTSSDPPAQHEARSRAHADCRRAYIGIAS